MFINDNPIWSAAEVAAQAAQSSTNADETFVEGFLASLIAVLTDDARQIFWRVVNGLNASDQHRIVYATEMLRALRHADRCRLAATDIIDEFGGLEGVTLVGLLLWLTQQHGYVLMEDN